MGQRKRPIKLDRKANPAVPRSWAFFVFFLISISASAASAANIYIVPGGTGAGSGTDWSNAAADLPATPSCGVTYFLAGGTYDYTSHGVSWSVNCTASNPINIYKAVSGGPGNPQNVAGWQAAYGTNQAVFNQTVDPDPMKNHVDFFNFSGSYITLDGIVPISGTPSASASYGIMLKSSNNMLEFIKVTASNVTIRHIEANGIQPQYGFQITACSRTNNVVTMTLAQPAPWIAGDAIDIFNSNPTDFNSPNPGNGIPAASISGNTITYNQTGPNETCSPGVNTYTSLARSGPDAIGLNIAGTANFSVTDSYMHDILASNGAMVVSCTSCTFARNYVARNRSTPTQHQQAIAGPGANAFTIAQNIFEDITGTSYINPTCGGACTWNNVNIWSNLFTCSVAAGNNAGKPYLNPQCIVSSVVSDDNGGNAISNSVVYGNTIVRQPNCYFYFINSASVGNVATNNLFYCPGGNQAQITGSGVTKSYNTFFATAFYPTDTGVGDYHLTSYVDPFVDSSDIGKNFKLSSEIIDAHLNDGAVLSSAYGPDLAGATHGTDGTWERGAYEFNTGGSSSTDTTPPTVAITSPSNGSTVSGTISIAGTAADNVGVANVQVSIDGGAYAPASGAGNWTFSLNTASLTNASHTISAKAADTSGNISTAASISVTVNNAVFSPCDINKDGVTNVMDVQLEVNAALGVIACAPAYDLNQDGLCNVIDVQRVVNAALGGKCLVGP